MAMLSIILYIVFGYLLLLVCVPKGNFVSEGLHFPFWFMTLRQLVKQHPKGKKIAYGSHSRQYLLHYEPRQNASPKRHIIIYLHGSGWQFGRPEMFRANAQWMASLGYHAFFLSHRRIPKYDIRGLREDIALGIKWVVDHQEALGLADKEIILCGNSAGGHLSALALFDSSLLKEVNLAPSIISAIALFSAPLDLSAMWNSPPLQILTRRKDAQLFQLANPIAFLEKAPEIPILLVHGDKDGLVEVESTISFHEKLKLLHCKNLRFETIKGGTHLDTASWCFPEHPSNKIFVDWLDKLEHRSIN